MWMTGYGGDGGELNLPDSFHGRKLRPLIPRPAPTSISTNPTNAPCLSRIHGSDLLVLNHHLASVAEQSKREYNTQQQVVVSSRWNPTPEQLQTLEELYRRGTRTPSADQIQHITAQLRRYGKIEGKNVFYWFQNHKARERQKRRRQLELLVSERETETGADKKESGANKTGFEVEQTKSWALPTNCSTTLAEKAASIQRAAGVPECRTDGGVQFPEEELHQRRSLLERNATWQMMHFSSSPPTHSLINPTAAPPTYTVTTTTNNSQTVQITPPKLLKGFENLNKFLTLYGEDVNLVSSGQDGATEAVSESQTLQLFPLGREEGNENITEETEILNGAMDSNFTPYQFFEFLPLKN